MRKLLLLILSLLLLAGCSMQNGDQEDQRKKSYEHISFASSITSEDCVICGDSSEHILSWYIGQENVALVDDIVNISLHFFLKDV